MLDFLYFSILSKEYGKLLQGSYVKPQSIFDNYELLISISEGKHSLIEEKVESSNDLNSL